MLQFCEISQHLSEVYGLWLTIYFSQIKLMNSIFSTIDLLYGLWWGQHVAVLIWWVRYVYQLIRRNFLQALIFSFKRKESFSSNICIKTEMTTENIAYVKPWKFSVIGSPCNSDWGHENQFNYATMLALALKFDNFASDIDDILVQIYMRAHIYVHTGMYVYGYFICASNEWKIFS